MKAVLAKTLGPADNLVIEDIPAPDPGPGEVRVRVHAAGLNFFDTLIIEGKYQTRPELPFSPGAEFCGVIEALGEGVSGWRIGERVAGYSGYNAAREAVIASADRIVRVPEGLSDEQAAALQITYGTTIHALIDRAQLREGETLAVLGAAGGTGVAAIEIGKALGARVIACASTPEKLAFARQCGADETIDYTRENLRDRLKELTGGAGVDVLYDPVGGDLAEPAVRAMGWGGRYLVIGFAAGEIPRIPLNLLLLKGCDLRGVFWGAFCKRDPQANAAHLAQLMDWAVAGRISARVEQIFPLDETPQALKLMADRKALGKIVVKP
ncbi:MAG: NADPH:quinone oxidoreductase family protein [Salinarimonas sp.]